jgi:signal transduction histidine kinase
MSDAYFRLKPIHAKALVCALGLLVFGIDIVVPADLDVAIFYCFVVALCLWTRSLVFLWASTAIFTAATIPGLLFSPPPVQSPSWVDWANRLFGLGALLLVAVVVHLRMRAYQLLEQTIVAKQAAEHELRDSESRLKLAQLAGHIGSWEWHPQYDRYTWSRECYDIFGIDPADAAFVTKWMAAINAVDLSALRAELACCSENREFDFDYRYDHPSRGQRWIHTRAKAFTSAQSDLTVCGIADDVTERKQVEAFLQESQSMLEVVVEQRTADLRKLSAKLLQSQDEERRKIARELHDSFGQYLAILKINLDQLAGVGSSTALQRKHDEQLLSECLETVERCIVETRTLSHLLHPPLLDEAGFASAARWYVEGFANRSKVKMRLDLPVDFPRLASALELGLFRALQESLTNVHRYSGASEVDICVAADAEEVLLTVQDNGRGIAAEIVREFRDHGSGVGIGLSGMRERMIELGGRLELSSGDAHGTLVCARVPLSKPPSKVVASKNIA